MLKMILIAGASVGGGFVIAQQADKLFANPKVGFDDKWSASTKEAVRNGIAAGSGVGLFAVLSKVL